MDVVGVTKDWFMKPWKVRFRVSAAYTLYIRTKPFHQSQMVVDSVGRRIEAMAKYYDCPDSASVSSLSESYDHASISGFS